MARFWGVPTESPTFHRSTPRQAQRKWGGVKVASQLPSSPGSPGTFPPSGLWTCSSHWLKPPTSQHTRVIHLLQDTAYRMPWQSPLSSQRTPCNTSAPSLRSSAPSFSLLRKWLCMAVIFSSLLIFTSFFHLARGRPLWSMSQTRSAVCFCKWSCVGTQSLLFISSQTAWGCFATHGRVQLGQRPYGPLSLRRFTPWPITEKG